MSRVAASTALRSVARCLVQFEAQVCRVPGLQAFKDPASNRWNVRVEASAAPVFTACKFYVLAGGGVVQIGAYMPAVSGGLR